MRWGLFTLIVGAAVGVISAALLAKPKEQEDTFQTPFSMEDYKPKGKAWR